MTCTKNSSIAFIRSQLTILLGLICLFVPAYAEPPDKYPFVSYDQGLQQASQSGKPIFVYFGRYGCGWCDRTNKVTFSDPALRKRYIDHYVLVYVDAESGHRLTLPDGERITELELGARLNVFATPVFYYLEADGTPIFSAPGFKTVEDFTKFDNYVQGGHYKTTKLTDYLNRQ